MKSPKNEKKIRNGVYNVLGIICVIMGIIGVFLPIWPTTVFAIAASILFSKANPRLYNWLLKSRLLGPYLDNYHNKRGITMAYKIRTCIILWAGLLFSMTFIEPLWLYFLLTAIGVAVSIHVLVIKTREPKENEITTLYNINTCIYLWVWLGLAVFLTEGLWQYLLLIIGGTLTAIVLVCTTKFKEKKVTSKKSLARNS